MSPTNYNYDPYTMTRTGGGRRHDVNWWLTMSELPLPDLPLDCGDRCIDKQDCLIYLWMSDVLQGAPFASTVSNSDLIPERHGWRGRRGCEQLWESARPAFREWMLSKLVTLEERRKYEEGRDPRAISFWTALKEKYPDSVPPHYDCTGVNTSCYGCVLYNFLEEHHLGRGDGGYCHGISAATWISFLAIITGTVERIGQDEKHRILLNKEEKEIQSLPDPYQTQKPGGLVKAPPPEGFKIEFLKSGEYIPSPHDMVEMINHLFQAGVITENQARAALRLSTLNVEEVRG